MKESNDEANHGPRSLGPQGEPADSDIFWNTDEFWDRLVSLLVHDRETLEKCAALLSPDDFKPFWPDDENGEERWLVATRALEFWGEHHDPIGKRLLADLSAMNVTDARLRGCRRYIGLLGRMHASAADAPVEKVIRGKSKVLRTRALLEMMELHVEDQLTDERLREIAQRELLRTANPFSIH